MRSKIVLYLNSFGYRIKATAIALLFLNLPLGLILFERLNWEQIAIVVLMIAAIPICFRHVFFNYVYLDLKRERLIIRDDFFGEKVYDRPLEDIKNLRIIRGDSMPRFDGKYFIVIEHFKAHKQAVRIEPKIKLRLLSRYKPTPSEEQYREHEKSFIEFESCCNLILKEYQAYRESEGTDSSSKAEKEA